MIIPSYGHFAKRINPRDNSDYVSDEPNNDGNLSPQNQAIVGAVVGGVALIASEPHPLPCIVVCLDGKKITMTDDSLEQ